ncbi:uncharacterized protein LOC142164815 [Nicotiana tabacum]|uniref:Uncharacterized protein LOC142164815 n=1 Tax=Nicotiana tabacum TaxID=4097 RepID=A0AC58S3T0_TOBAC
MIEAWKHSYFLYKNYILSGLEDDLYNIYSNVETSKELWEMLEKKYKIEDAGLKNLVEAKFLDYKMVDHKHVITQVQELQVITHDLLVKGLVINETFQVAAMIEKLPPLWRDFKNYLKYKHKEMKLEDLIVRLRIEKDNKAIDSGATHHVCAVREAFASYAPAGPDETIFIGNSATAKIESYGKISLKMTSDKVVTLNNVCHVPEIRKNLVSFSLLVKNGFKYVFVSDKIIISKNEMYLGNVTLLRAFSS